MDYRYPIGKYETHVFTHSSKEKHLLDIKHLPDELKAAVSNLNQHQLNVPYREGGWTIRQVVHHIADSHMNAYIRFKLGLTEDNPTIKPYDENAWSKLDDIDTVPVEVSVNLVRALHQRWYATMKNLTEEQFERTVLHPDHGKKLSLWYLLGLYAWHGKHHVAHITSLRERNNW